jgi:hypothetical protein
MLDAESTTYGDFTIEAHAIPMGHMWAAEYTVRQGKSTRIIWKLANIMEGMPTHRAAIDAAFDCARRDIDKGAFDPLA